MKKVVFYFKDGSYKWFFAYGTTNQECISDAKGLLTSHEIEEIDSVSVYKAMPSEI
jgi:hypothetical protein